MARPSGRRSRAGAQAMPARGRVPPRRRMGAARWLIQDPTGDGAPEWQAFRGGVTGDAGAVKVPATETAVQPGETLEALAERLIAGTTGVAALLPWVAALRILRPLALIKLDIQVPAGAADTLRSVAEGHGLTLAELARQTSVTGTPGLV